MTLIVTLPPGCARERRYVCSVLLLDFLGIDIIFKDDKGDCIRISDGDGRTLRLDDTFFSVANTAWLKSASLPTRCKHWDTYAAGFDGLTIEAHLPVLFGRDPQSNDFFTEDSHQISLGLDVFGSAFFMLSRYEEAVAPTLDGHGRCLGAMSSAAIFGFLHRPIIDEYTEILWACMTRLWPGLKRKSRVYAIAVSHDVDKPYEYAFRTPGGIARLMASQLVRSKDVRQAIVSARSWISARARVAAPDPCENFDAIMTASEKRGLRSAFYFIVDRPAGQMDCDYDFRHPLIQRLVQRISRRGHEIGLHGSYLSYCEPDRLTREFLALKDACAKLGALQSKWGSRQHFLRWKTPETFIACSSAGIDYDSSLGYADMVGFRCGVCREYPAYDILNRKALALVERPLIAMDCTIMDQRYMALGTSEKAFEVLAGLKQTCRRFEGTFSLLWHNSRMVNVDELRLYLSVLDA
jgi:hypothetical protein